MIGSLLLAHVVITFRLFLFETTSVYGDFWSLQFFSFFLILYLQLHDIIFFCPYNNARSKTLFLGK